MHIDDPKTTNINGKYYGSFWNPIGGTIEENESLEDAAIREVHEETGIVLTYSDLGPIVWYGAFDLVLNGILTHIKQSYIIAKTNEKGVHLENLTDDEKEVVLKLKWFSLKDLYGCEEIIYPVVLLNYVEDIFSGKFPKNPLKIDLSKKPDSE